jgi:mRNA-degrading endonuclease toxin of MazEF toxin-antitoxin module
MSLSEIIDELPRLSHQERRELCRRVIDLESEHEDMMLCDHIAREGFAMLDRMEVEQEAGGQSATRRCLAGGHGHRGQSAPVSAPDRLSADDELAMVTVLPHTTAVKGNRWELNIPKPFLKPGAFHFQQIQSISVAYLMRRLGALTVEEMDRVTDMLCQRLRC